MKQINYTGSSKLIARIVNLLNRKVPLPLDGSGDPAWGTNGQVLSTDGSGNTLWVNQGGGGGGGDTVTWTQEQLTGTKIAEIEINGTSQDVYAPSGGGGGGAEILYGIVDPDDVQQGNDGDLYCKYISGAGISKIFGKVSGTWLLYSPFLEYVWDFRVSLNAINNGTAVTLAGSSRRTQNGVEFYGQDGYVSLPVNLLQMGYTYEIHIASLNMAYTGTHNRVFMFTTNNSHDAGFLWRSSGKWAVWDPVNLWQESSITDKDYFNDSVLKIKITTDGKWHIYKDDVLIFEPANAITLRYTAFVLGATTQGCYNMTISEFRIYPNAD